MSKPVSDKHQPVWRLGFVFAVLAALGGVLCWKVADLQVLHNDVLQREGDARTVRDDPIIATRGNIVDRNGEPLAISTPVLSLWLNPKEVLSHAEQWPQLADALTSIGIDPDDMRKRITDAASREFLYVKRRLPPAEAQAILDRRLSGIYAQEEYKRFYPMGEAAAHLVGLTNNDEIGQEGMELAHEEWLRGIPGSKRVLKDRLGRIVREIAINATAQPGKDLVLSIDSRLQYLAYKSLKEAVTLRHASAGTATVLDVRTGEVLAMVSQPSYNPNNRSTMTDAGKRNRVMTDVLEPGSTTKTFTVTAALESGLFTPESIIDTSPGVVRVDRGKVVEDPVNYGPSTLERILYKSSQVGATKLAMAMGEEPILSVLRRVGFGQGLDTSFPGEAPGALPIRERWRKTEIATLGYGYGYQVSPMQLARAYAIYANRGIAKPVSLLRVDGPVPGERVIDAGIADTVVNMLRSVVGKVVGGTGVRAAIPSYDVAGKTGTTWFYDVSAGGYDSSNYISHFAGMVPVDDPRIVIVVSIQRPQGAETGGGQVAAPVFAEIATGAMRILNVPPDVPQAAEAELSMAYTGGAEQ
ncbi:MAG: peptidoglycan D,D-transpeptidase FtsI family protein [Pseudohongiellaceae bacterium]